MQNLLEWSLNLIRSKESLGWVEEYHLEWINLISRAISEILKGKPLLLYSDSKREWFVEYILSSINSKNRPLIPIYRLNGLIKDIKRDGDVEDLLSITFLDGYLFWYIGKEPDSKIFKEQNSMLWLIQNSKKGELFFEDERIDVRLIELFWLFDSSLEGAIFGEFELDGTL